jgi:homoserine O-acetyltransferase
MRITRSVAVIVALIALPAFAQELSDQKFATLGDFRVESGETLRDCRVGYRTAGELNAARSNAILVPTWFAGRSGDLRGWIGPGKLLDTKRWFVIAVDAFGNGVSSSPSISAQRPFPTFTIRDMVRSQHELVTEELKLDGLHAIVGLSMGGMQAFQWVLSYPQAARLGVSIAGTPRQTAHDIMLWQTELDLLETFSDSVENQRKAMKTIAALQAMEIRTPAWIVDNVPDARAHLENYRKSLERLDPGDYMAQLRAMLAHDVFRDFNGSMDAAAAALKAKLLVVVALQDQMVNPGPSRELARKAGSELVTLTGPCGHLASSCESEILIREVQRFLEH